MEILDDNTGNWLVQFDDGTTKTVAKSKQNRLLMEYDLWGLLRDGTEVLTTTHDDTDVAVVPGDGAREFTLKYGEFEPLHLDPHEKSRLVDAIFEGKDPDSERGLGAALVGLFDDIRENRVRSDVIGALHDAPPFKGVVAETSRGWLFNDHLLLTYNAEFYHPDVESRTRSGGAVSGTENQEAYELSVSPSDSMDRELTIDDTTYRLTDAEMEFVAKALWASKMAPTEVR